MAVEIKEMSHISKIIHVGRKIARIIRERPGNSKIIVDSFQNELIASIKHQCDCEAGLDTPYKKPLNEAALTYIKNMNMDWIYVHHSVINSQLIQNAHQKGLKVMAYTVNSVELINQWSTDELPDGIITDNINVTY